MVLVYGIPNCDTVKKARAWLVAHDVPYVFHDFKRQGLPADRLLLWASAVGWDNLLNRHGTTWRKLDAVTQATAQTPAGALALAIANPSVIKRPVVEWRAGALDEMSAADLSCESISVGFNDSRWDAHAKKWFLPCKALNP